MKYIFHLRYSSDIGFGAGNCLSKHEQRNSNETNGCLSFACLTAHSMATAVKIKRIFLEIKRNEWEICVGEKARRKTEDALTHTHTQCNVRLEDIYVQLFRLNQHKQKRLSFIILQLDVCVFLDVRSRFLSLPLCICACVCVCWL